MGSLIFYVSLLAVGGVLYLVFRGGGDLPRAVGEPKRAMPTGPLDPVIFKCPLAKCPVCAGSADKMRQEWDGLRKVAWICGYCGNPSVQELDDNELPQSARRRMGLGPAAGG